jgi:hypothetical protein
MKKYILSFLLVLILSAFVVSNNVNSQDTIPPCTMDCLPQSPWIPDVSGWHSVDPVNCPGCFIQFKFWYRASACGVFKDLQLDEFTLSSACNTCPKSIKDYVDFAVDLMILNNPLPKPANGTCETIWRAVNASCWRPLLTVDSVFVPCENSECCWRTLTMCADISGNLSYTENQNFPAPNLCHIHQGNCTYVCDEAPEPAPMPSGLDENTNLQNGFSTLVYPNPGSDWFNIKFRSESEGQHTIEVFDASGNMITIKDFGKVQDEVIIQLNMSSLSSGNYRYVIKHNDKPGISGSFNVVK